MYNYVWNGNDLKTLIVPWCVRYREEPCWPLVHAVVWVALDKTGQCKPCRGAWCRLSGGRRPPCGTTARRMGPTMPGTACCSGSPAQTGSKHSYTLCLRVLFLWFLLLQVSVTLTNAHVLPLFILYTVYNMVIISLLHVWHYSHLIGFTFHLMPIKFIIKYEYSVEFLWSILSICERKHRWFSVVLGWFERS